MTYKTAKTLKVNTFTIKDALKGFYHFDPDAEGEDKHVPLFDITKKGEHKICKVIAEGLEAGGFKNWKEVGSLKGIGPVTLQKLKSIGLSEYVYFFYEENPLSSEITRVSKFFTLKQVKRRSPSGANWRSPNPKKQISKEFCAGAMEEISWPGAKKKGLKYRDIPRKTSHVDIAVGLHKELMIPSNHVLSEGGRLMGWKFSNPEADRKPYGYERDGKTFVRFLATKVNEAEGDKLIYPDGDMFLVERPIPSGLHTGDCTLIRPLELTEDLTVYLAALMNVPCKLVNIYRSGKSGLIKTGFNEEGFNWKLAPKAEQSHDLVLKDPMPGLTDTDKEHHNVVMASLSEQDDLKRAALEEKRRKENEDRVAKGLKPKLFGRDWIEHLYEVYLEMTGKNGWGAAMEEAEEKLKDFQAKEEAYEAFFKPLFRSWCFLREFEQKWFKASKHAEVSSAIEDQYSELMKDAPGTFHCWQSLNKESARLSKEITEALAEMPKELRDMKWKFEKCILNTKLETQFEERAQKETIGGDFNSGNAKMFSTVEEGLRSEAHLALESLATRADTSWEASCLEAMKENIKDEHIWITGLNPNIGRLGYAEKQAHMRSKLNLLRNGSEEFEVTLREITRWNSGHRWVEGPRVEVFDGYQSLDTDDETDGATCLLPEGYFSSGVVGAEEVVYLKRTFNWDPSTLEVIQEGGVFKSEPMKEVETEEDFWAQIDAHGKLNK